MQNDAEKSTIKINSAIYDRLDFKDKSEYENATRGLIAAPEALEIKNDAGMVVWSQKAYSFLDEFNTPPNTVNPSLWENTRNNHAYGLFKVTDGIYQVRGYDMANLTVVAGKTGWIVMDTTMCRECAEACMRLIEENLEKRPVKAVIISHSHVDHFGGIGGIMSKEEAADPSLPIEEQLAGDKIPIIVPMGFEKAAISENLMAGQAMQRRATFQYGVYLNPGPKGSMSIGIGMGQSRGITTYISPTHEVKRTGEKITIDGVEFEFQITPNTEAPAEMNTWIPSLKALWLAENCTCTLHNIYTLRGAKVRDANAWAAYLTEAAVLYGTEADVVFQSHNWPHWGNAQIRRFIDNTAAAYKFIHDQTLTYINQGYTSDEISNMIELPYELYKNWYTRQYYGTVAHNSKAVYQNYMGWYDANPVHLHPLTPTENAKKWVQYLGDIDRVLELAAKDYEDGQYQWVAEITNTIVFADPKNEKARLLCAKALEQLGYQAESGTWRNCYLMGAKELREGNAVKKHGGLNLGGTDMVECLPVPEIFDYMGVIADKQAFSGKSFRINFVLADIGERHMVYFNNGAVLRYANYQAEDADVTVTTAKGALLYLVGGYYDNFVQLAQIQGDESLLRFVAENLTQPGSADFNIVEP